MAPQASLYAVKVLDSNGSGYLSDVIEGLFALTEKGEVYAWGRNDRGELGIGHDNDIKTPTRVKLAHKIKQIVPSAFALALTENGEIYTWGVTNFGVNPGDSITYETTPMKFDLPEKVAKICKAGTGLAISESGSLYSWGWNYYGEMGDGTRTNSFKPHKLL